MRFAFISVIGEHHPRRLSNFATTVFVIKASFYCVEAPCSATVSSAWLIACAAFVEGGYHASFFSYMPITSPPPGYYACFFSLIPITSPLAGYYACFSSLIPILSPSPGYHACFFSHIPITSPLTGYYACFSSLIPTISPLSGYYACFFSPIPTTTILLKKGAELMLDSLKFKSIR